MPDDQIFALILAILAGIFIALVLGVVAFFRTRRLKSLAHRVEVLEHALRARGAAPYAPPAPATERPPGAWVPRPIPLRPEPPAAPEPTVPAVPSASSEPLPAPTPIPLEAFAAEPEPPVSVPPIEAPPPVPFEITPSPSRRKGLDWER